ncbi:MAG: hypothetical protein P8P74_03235 [Crocinitomicaceae bacterium]|nr:hypothetical protein [Crocinitomicaceae bacterium]
MLSSIENRRGIPYLILKMTVKTSILVAFILIFSSCESTETETKKRNLVSKEHAALIGNWQEEDSTETTLWSFDQYEVKWKGFTHAYRVSGDSLIISGMVYQIVEQSDKKMKILNLDGKPCILNRKE